MAAIPLIKEIKRNYPLQPIFLSTITVTGNLTAQRNAKSVDRIIYFPFDYPFLVKMFLLRIKPIIFITIETEIWPNFLRQLDRQQVPSIMISGRISHHSFRNYYFFRFFFKKVLRNIAFFCMQTDVDADRIVKIGANPQKVMITGNIKFDQQIPAITVDEKEALYQNLHLKKDTKIFIAGSTHSGEEEIILNIYQVLKKDIPDLVLLLAPRHPERFDEVATLIHRKGILFTRKTTLGHSLKDPPNEVILLDTIGELSKIYSIGTFIFVGGSLVPIGGHNALEPAVFKKAVLFGPHMENFSEIAKILLKNNGALQVHSEEEFIQNALRLLRDNDFREKLGSSAFHVVEKHCGAVEKSMEIMKPILKKRESPVIRSAASAQKA
jgi:3-deoxy-D-manno-octulosonic-acid transferase